MIKFFHTVPLLEEITDPGLKKSICRVLHLIALKTKAIPDFLEFDEYLKAHKDSPPLSLISFMYRIEPEGAVVAMARLYESPESAKKLAEDLRKAERQTLEMLAESDKWWKNLYVPAKMLEAPKLRSSTLIEKLKESKHPLVREAVHEFQELQKNRLRKLQEIQERMLSTHSSHVRALSYLSKSDDFRDQRFVVEEIMKNPEYYDQVLVERLKKSEYEIIRERIQKLEKRRKESDTNGSNN